MIKAANKNVFCAAFTGIYKKIAYHLHQHISNKVR
jgi:hypothetical protein